MVGSRDRSQYINRAIKNTGAGHSHHSCALLQRFGAPWHHGERSAASRARVLAHARGGQGVPNVANSEAALSFLFVYHAITLLRLPYE